MYDDEGQRTHSKPQTLQPLTWTNRFSRRIATGDRRPINCIACHKCDEGEMNR